ncbi:hypothetical protein L2E82_49193 [Cichorium intybus]|uniref:Uncharacterized protein n=1 Tax=Cichorium intybus TaxID=13427 RepID=A0ACB8YZT1_CICIN|nr:hypothetical protein L2E82_49193 [Cichorium intybus]
MLVNLSSLSTLWQIHNHDDIRCLDSIHTREDWCTTRKTAFNDTHCVSLKGTDDTQMRVIEAPVINER